jgi:hypothetical protein
MRAGGLDPLRRFVEGVIEDGGRNAWLVAADSLVWRVACQAAPLTEAYPEVITVDPLDTSELEAAILARHGLSGYSLNFESRAERTRLDELFAEGAGRIRRPYESFFQSIHAASGGRVRDALRLWIAAIDEVNETSDLVHIGKVPESPHAAIRQLPEAILLMLYQVARQGWMDAAVQAAVFRVDEVTAEAQLARLAHLGLLEPREHDTYRIPSHLREAVNRALLEKGWIR